MTDNRTTRESGAGGADIIQLALPGTTPTAEQLGAAAMLLAELRRAGVVVKVVDGGRLHFCRTPVRRLTTDLLERTRELEPAILSLFSFIGGSRPEADPHEDEIPF